MIPEYTVGQKVWVKYSQRKELTEETVQSVGRKWVVLGRRVRFERLSRYTDSPTALQGRVYLSREQYEMEDGLGKRWAECKHYFRNNYSQLPPEGVTVEDIQTALKLLRLAT